LTAQPVRPGGSKSAKQTSRGPASAAEAARAERPARAARKPSRWDFVAPLAVVAAALALYLPSLSFQFLNWDDPTYVLNNPWIRSWSSANLVRIFTKPYFGNFLPLHLLSYTVDYTFWTLNPLGYHLQSVLLHALNAWLALILVRRMFGGFAMPFLAALFFAVHPSHLEAVAWVSIRKDLLSTSFALLSVYFYLGAIETKSLRWGSYLASIACFGLALLAKVTTVTIPLFFLVLDRMKDKGAPLRGWGVDLASKIPYAYLGLTLIRLNTEAQSKARAAYAHEALSYAVVKGHAAWKYLGLLTGLLRGSPDYDLPILGKDPATVLLSIAGLAVLPAAAWIAYRYRNRAVALGCAWIFVTLLPALAFPLVTYMADRYLYLPSLGFCWVLAVAIEAAARRVAEPRRRVPAMSALCAVLLLLFVGRSVQNLPTWRDSDSLWTYAMTRCNDFRCYTNLAEVRIGQGRLDEAERLLKIAAQVDNPTTYQNLEVVYFQERRYPEALAAIDRAIAILRRQGWNPELASVLEYNRGSVYARMGDIPRTILALEVSLRENPENEQARAQLQRFRAQANGP